MASLTESGCCKRVRRSARRRARRQKAGRISIMTSPAARSPATKYIACSTNAAHLIAKSDPPSHDARGKQSASTLLGKAKRRAQKGFQVARGVNFRSEER